MSEKMLLENISFQDISRPRYSLWIMPDDNKLLYFQEIINDIAKRTNSEVFSPHVTLLGGVEENSLDKLVDSIKKGVKLPSLNLGLMHHSDYFFQSIFYSLVHNDALISTHLNLAKVIDKSDSFFPHMSVHYGNLDREFKQDIIRQYNSAVTYFVPQQLHLVETSKPVLEWKPIYKTIIF